MSNQLNPFIANEEKAKNDRPLLDRLNEQLIGIGFVTQLQYDKLKVRVLLLKGDFLKLDFARQEVWEADEVEVPIVPGQVLGQSSTIQNRLFAVTKLKELVVRVDQNAGNAVQLIRDLRRAARPEMKDKAGRRVDLKVFKEVAEETFKGVPDAGLVDAVQRRQYIHEALHIFRERKKYVYKPINAEGQPIDLPEDFGFSAQEWNRISPDYHAKTDVELDAYLGHIALSDTPYWEFFIMAAMMDADRLTDNEACARLTESSKAWPSVSHRIPNCGLRDQKKVTDFAD